MDIFTFANSTPERFALIRAFTLNRPPYFTGTTIFMAGYVRPFSADVLAEEIEGTLPRRLRRCFVE